MPGRINGFSLAYTATGGIVLWSGIRGWTISQTFKQLLSGKTPTGASTEPIAVNQTTAADTAISNASTAGGKQAPHTVTSIANFGLAGLIASTYGWPPGTTEFAALTEVISAESDGNPDAMNPSGAYGIAQALGHATPADAGSVSRTAYGGYGVPTATNVGANSGNASDQLVWMMAYIKAAYGDPAGAWDNEQTKGFY